MKTNSLFSNVIKILKTRNTASLVDILYLKKEESFSEYKYIKPNKPFVRLCNIEITPKMCMDEAVGCFYQGPSFYDQCL